MEFRFTLLIIQSSKHNGNSWKEKVQTTTSKKKQEKLCNTFFLLVRHHLISRVAHAKLNKILINPNKLRAYDTTQSS